MKIDDAYLGGKRVGTPGRGSPNKVSFFIVVSAVDDRKPRKAVLRCAPFTSEAYRDWANASLAAETEAVFDGAPAIGMLRDEIVRYQALVTGFGRALAEHPKFR